MTDETKDEWLECQDCGDMFKFTAAERNYYQEKNLYVPPIRLVNRAELYGVKRYKPGETQSGNQRINIGRTP